MTVAESWLEVLLQHHPRSLQTNNRSSLAGELASVVLDAKARWPTILVDETRFVAYLAVRIPADSSDLASALSEMHTDSLYLACACADGNELAIGLFDSECCDQVESAVARFDRSGDLADETKQQLREKLFLAGRITEYGGRGAVRLWIRAVATRIALDLIRSRRRHDDRHRDASALWVVADATADPAVAYLRRHYGEELRASFAETLESMPSKERTILRFHYVDGLNIEEIGRIYDVHKTTVFRWLEKSRLSLVNDTRIRLQQRVGIERDQIDSVMQLIDSELHLSIHRLLADE